MSPRPWSLAGRLARHVTLAVTLAWLVSLAAGVWVISHEMTELLDESLKQQGRAVLDLYRLAGPAAVPSLDAETALRVEGLPGALRDAPWPPLAQDGLVQRDGWQVLRLSDPGRGLAIELGKSALWRRHELMESARAFVLLMLPLLGVVLLVTLASARSAMAPAGRLAARMGARPAQDLSALPAADLPRELVPVAAALNGYLARIDTLIRAERAFAAHAAHELRTPLAAASAQAQLVALGQAGPEASARVVESLDRLGHVVERLLQLARAEAGIGSTPAGAVDLLRILRLLLADAPPGRVRLDDADLETAPVAVEADALAILLRNLIENALTHGTGLVEIRLKPSPGQGAGPGGLGLRIANPTAPGARFLAGRFDKGAGSGGAGLGLAIVEAIAAQIPLPIRFEMTEGRAEVLLTLPVPPRP